MKNNLLEHIILYVIVASVALIIATLARISATAMGFDSFTNFMVFIIALAIQVVVYLSIHVFLQGLMLPWIGKGLSKIPCFKNKMEKNMEPTPVGTNETIIEQSSLKDIRKEQQLTRIKEQEKKLNTAISYTKKIFAPYVSDEEIEILCVTVRKFHLYSINEDSNHSYLCDCLACIRQFFVISGASS